MSEHERIAILGGTFDPIHRGHTDPIIEIRAPFGWSRVVLMPASVQPFKKGVVTASPFHRYAMAVLAAESLPAFEASPLELERGSTSYTVDTLEALRMTHPRATLEWVIGDDNLDGLDRWKDLDRILDLANLVVLRRRGRANVVPKAVAPRVSSVEERKRAGSVVMAENAIVAISATMIRERLLRGEGIENLVFPAVARYVERYSLYV